MPARWAPWPVNRKAVPPLRTEARTSSGSAPSAVSAARPASRPRGGRAAAEDAPRAARSAGRAVASERPMSGAAAPGARWRARAGSRPGRGGPRSCARTTARPPVPSPRRVGPCPLPTARAAAGLSRMTWALVPLKPKEETAARRGRPARSRGHATALGEQPDRPATSPRARRARSTCRVCGSIPCRMASTILITPATPAAAWVCPMLDFTEPSHSGRSSGRS